MAEGAPLLREYTLIAYRGFESLSLRHKKSPFLGAFVMAEREGVEIPRGSTKMPGAFLFATSLWLTRWASRAVQN